MLELRNVHKRFGLQAGFFARVTRYVYAVNGVSLTIGDGEIYGLVGESGCGKTSTARLIVGMYRPDGGQILFTARDGRRYPLHALEQQQRGALRGKVKYVFQDPARSLNPRMSILQILTTGYRYSPLWPGGREAEEQARAILTEVGLQGSDLGRRPADFSGGQRQRIAIARALMVRPELLICDEVVSALDVSIQSQILELLLRLREQHGFAMLFIAHDLAVVSYIADRVGVMYRGLLVEEAPAVELVSRREHPYTRHLYASIPRLQAGRPVSIPAPRFGEMPDPTEQVVEPGRRVELQRVGEQHYVLPEGVI